MTVIFGLYHGLVFFPVLLSVLGPQGSSGLEQTETEITKGKSTGLPNPGFVNEDHTSASTSGIEVIIIYILSWLKSEKKVQF